MTDQLLSWCKPDMIDEMRTVTHDAFSPQNAERNDAIIQLFADTGVRGSELVSLRKTHFNDDDGTLFMPSDIQKAYPNGTHPDPATLSLSNETIRTVRTYLKHDGRDSEYLFPSRQSPDMSVRSLNYMLKKAARVAEIEPRVLHEQKGWIDGDPGDVSTHTFRHSVAYRMLVVEDGNDIYDVMRRLRHKKIETTINTYSHFDSR